MYVLRCHAILRYIYLYRATTCSYHRDRPTTHYIISGIGEYPYYGKRYICKLCADFFDSLSNCELDRRSIVGVYKIM